MSEHWKVAGGPLERLRAWWCRLMHDSAMWPIHGSYQCRTCGRRYAVPWAAVPAVRPIRVRGLWEERAVKRAA